MLFWRGEKIISLSGDPTYLGPALDIVNNHLVQLLNCAVCLQQQLVSVDKKLRFISYYIITFV
jgi:hypothetical protein